MASRWRKLRDKAPAACSIRSDSPTRAAAACTAPVAAAWRRCQRGAGGIVQAAPNAECVRKPKKIGQIAQPRSMTGRAGRLPRIQTHQWSPLRHRVSPSAAIQRSRVVLPRAIGAHQGGDRPRSIATERPHEGPCDRDIPKDKVLYTDHWARVTFRTKGPAGPIRSTANYLEFNVFHARRNRIS